MKTQAKFPYHQTVHCPNIIFHPVGRDSFYIYSCVLAADRIVTKGKEYIIFNNTTDTRITMSDVILVTCYYREGIITLIVRDIKSKGVFAIHHSLECHKNDCKWLLIDINYFVDQMDAKAIQSYCGKCNDHKNRRNSEINHNSSQDDLLEFEF